MRLKIEKSAKSENDEIAERIRQSLESKGIISINIMGAPGSGKTTFIEGISRHIKRMAVIQGDLESDIDKKRLMKAGIYTYQINTHSGCHLNADMVEKAVNHMELSGKNYLLIENVGNLVCPAGVDIGQHMNIVISATTEGSDKPRKYPIIFKTADIAIISKTDLAEASSFDENQYIADIKEINPDIVLAKTSSKEGRTFKEAAEQVLLKSGQ